MRGKEGALTKEKDTVKGKTSFEKKLLVLLINMCSFKNTCGFKKRSREVEVNGKRTRGEKFTGANTIDFEKNKSFFMCFHKYMLFFGEFIQLGGKWFICPTTGCHSCDT